LEAALEVNDHLKQDVENKGNEIQDLKRRLAAIEKKYELISQKLKESDKHEDPDVSKHVATVVRFPLQCESLLHLVHFSMHNVNLAAPNLPSKPSFYQSLHRHLHRLGHWL
jgi:hypothetical protein